MNNSFHSTHLSIQISSNPWSSTAHKRPVTRIQSKRFPFSQTIRAKFLLYTNSKRKLLQLPNFTGTISMECQGQLVKSHYTIPQFSLHWRSQDSYTNDNDEWDGSQHEAKDLRGGTLCDPPNLLDRTENNSLMSYQGIKIYEAVGNNQLPVTF